MAYDSAIVDAETNKLVANGNCKSDDEHIIALALVSGARILCTTDADLMDDFRDRLLLAPQGKIYSHASHDLMLRRKCPKH